MSFRRTPSGLDGAEPRAGARGHTAWDRRHDDDSCLVGSLAWRQIRNHSPPVVSGHDYKPQWLLYLSLCKTHWGGLSGIPITGPLPEILPQEVCQGLQPNQTCQEVPGQQSCRTRADAVYFVEMRERALVTSPKTQLSV